MNDLAGWKVRGPVRTLRRDLAEWDPSQGGVWQAPRGVTVATFRPDGQFSESEFHNPDGSIARLARVYDDGGRIIEAQSWMDDGPRTTVFYSYDARGRLTAAVDVAPDGTRREAESCRYDSAGRKTKISFLAAQQTDMAIAYGVEGTEQRYGAPGAATLTVAYDDPELPAEASFHDANGGLVRRIVFSRDHEGHVLTEVVHFGGEKPIPNLLSHADNVPLEERARVTALLTKVFADRTFSSTTYAYDQKGRLLERTIRMGSLSEERTTFRYDDHHNPIDEISENHGRAMDIDDDGVVHAKEEEPRVQHARFDYQYDAHGNWTERVVWNRTGSQPDFQRSNIERRTITYYDV